MILDFLDQLRYLYTDFLNMASFIKGINRYIKDRPEGVPKEFPASL
jgi:hypothetical protein